MALLDAWAFSLALRQEADVATGLRRAVALRHRHVRLYQAMSWLFAPVYQSDSRLLPFLRDQLVGPLPKAWPANLVQAAMVGGLIGSPVALA